MINRFLRNRQLLDTCLLASGFTIGGVIGTIIGVQTFENDKISVQIIKCTISGISGSIIGGTLFFSLPIIYPFYIGSIIIVYGNRYLKK